MGKNADIPRWRQEGFGGKSKSEEHTKGKVRKGGNMESVFKLTLISYMILGGIMTIDLFIS